MSISGIVYTRGESPQDRFRDEWELSRTKKVDLTFFYFLFSFFYFISDLFSFVLFLELGLGLG